VQFRQPFGILLSPSVCAIIPLTFNASHPECIDHVLGQSEGDTLRNLECFALSVSIDVYVFLHLVEETIQVDMDSVATQAVEQNILAMSITETDDQRHPECRSKDMLTPGRSRPWT
jgi:hypothetical protein